MTSTSQTVFTRSAAAAHDFVTNPENWTKTLPLFALINPAKIDAHHEAIAREVARPRD